MNEKVDLIIRTLSVCWFAYKTLYHGEKGNVSKTIAYAGVLIFIGEMIS